MIWYQTKQIGQRLFRHFVNVYTWHDRASLGKFIVDSLLSILYMTWGDLLFVNMWIVNPWNTSRTYTVNHWCTCRCPSTLWCWVISKQGAAHKLKLLFVKRSLVILWFAQHTLFKTTEEISRCMALFRKLNIEVGWHCVLVSRSWKAQSMPKCCKYLYQQTHIRTSYIYNRMVVARARGIERTLRREGDCGMNESARCTPEPEGQALCGHSREAWRGCLTWAGTIISCPVDYSNGGRDCVSSNRGCNKSSGESALAFIGEKGVCG